MKNLVITTPKFGRKRVLLQSNLVATTNVEYLIIDGGTSSYVSDYIIDGRTASHNDLEVINGGSA